MKKLNIVFAGTPEISAQLLKDLYKTQHAETLKTV